jgi:nitrate reductase NapE component
VATGPWDPGSARFLASDADRERVVDVLKTAFVHGTLTRDELTLRTGRALTARTYAELAGITAGLAPGAPRPASRPATQRPRRRRVSKKAIAWSACAVVLPPALSVAFLSYYGGFLVMMLFTFIGAVLLSKPPAPPRPPLAKSIGGKH